MRVLYLYAGTRKKSFEAWRRGLEPDTPLVGLNHMKQFGIEADFFENRFTEFFRRISFNLTQLPALFVMRAYDAAFSGAGLTTLFIAKYLLRWKRPKWFVYNTYLSNLLKRNKGGIKGWLIRKAIASADGVICPSTAQRNYLLQEGFDPKRIFYIPYGIDADFYIKNKEREERIMPEPYIMSAGRDVGRDYKTLIEAMKDIDTHLIIGALPRNFPGISTFPPHVVVNYFPPLSMPSLLHHAELVVIPTIPEEAMAGSDCSGQYVLLESMVSGKAVITTERSTLSDYFTSGEDGLTVPPYDAEALARAIKELRSDLQKTRAMGLRAQKKALARFTTKRFAEDFARILRESIT